MSGPSQIGQGDAGLHGRFVRQALLHPDRVALQMHDRAFTYSSLHQMALRQASELADTPDGAPAVVGVLANKSVEAYAAFLAALYVGAAVVPLRPDDSAQRISAMLESSGVQSVLADTRGWAILAAALPAGHGLRVLAIDRQRPHRGRVPDRRQGVESFQAPAPVDPNQTAYVMFTSGSTGKPKGVPVTHGAARHFFDVVDARYGFKSTDAFSQTFDLSFDCAVFDLFCAWGVGASVNPVPPAAYYDLPAFVAARKLTVWFSTPSAIALVRRADSLRPGSMSSLRWSLFAGEALRCADAEDWLAAAEMSTLENIYGPTELTISVAAHRWHPQTSPRQCVNGLVPIGRVHPGHSQLLLGDEEGCTDSEGELCIAGPQMTPGYVDELDDCSRFFHRQGRRWYRTGDRVCRQSNGELVYLGRVDSQVQVRGERVEPAEVEHALRQCPGVRDAVVVARAVADGVDLVAFYTGEAVLTKALMRQLRVLLPASIVPAEFRHIAQMPLNNNRKIDRKFLAEAARSSDIGR